MRLGTGEAPALHTLLRLYASTDRPDCTVQGSSLPKSVLIYINEGPLGGEDDAKSVFDRVNHVSPNRDAAGKKSGKLKSMIPHIPATGVGIMPLFCFQRKKCKGGR